MPKKKDAVSSGEWKPKSVSSGASSDNVPFFPQPLIPNSDVENDRTNTHAALEGFLRAGK